MRKKPICSSKNSKDTPYPEAEAVIAWRSGKGDAKACSCGHVIVVSSHCPFCEPHGDSMAEIQAQEDAFQAAERLAEEARRRRQREEALAERESERLKARQLRELLRLEKDRKRKEAMRREAEVGQRAISLMRHLEESERAWETAETDFIRSNAAAGCDWACRRLAALLGWASLLGDSSA